MKTRPTDHLAVGTLNLMTSTQGTQNNTSVVRFFLNVGHNYRQHGQAIGCRSHNLLMLMTLSYWGCVFLLLTGCDTVVDGYDEPGDVKAQTIQINPTTGPAGTIVRLTGLDASTTKEVYFGDAPATKFSIIDDGSLEATVPKDATSGEVRVKTNPKEYISDKRFEFLAPSSVCLAQEQVVQPTDFGSFAPNTPSDSLQRVQNQRTLNAAIANAPISGTICLPQGDYYLYPEQFGEGTGAHVNIFRGDITLWGAGNNRDGNGTGLHTRGATWEPRPEGKLFRGDGLRIAGSGSQNNPNQNITVRSLELNGHSGLTGNFAWPASQNAPDRFDLTHKGIHVTSNRGLEDVLIEDVWLHGYQGEITHGPGWSADFVKRLTFRNNFVENSNGGSWNIAAVQDLLVENNVFRDTQGWGELFSWPGFSGVFRGNLWENQHHTSGFAFHGNGIHTEQSWLFEDNTFRNCNVDSDNHGKAFAFTGGTAGPVVIRENRFEECDIARFQYVDNPDDPRDRGEGDPWNQHVTIEDNMVINSGRGLAIQFFGGYNRHIIVRNNTFDLSKTIASNTEAPIDYWSPRVVDSVIEDNTFIGRTPRTGGGTMRARPLFRNNTYADVAPRYDLIRGANSWSGLKDTAHPIFEQWELRLDHVNDETVELQLATEGYPDAQEVWFTVTEAQGSGGTLLLAPGNATYEVAEPLTFQEGDQFTLVFDGQAGHWVYKE